MEEKFGVATKKMMLEELSGKLKASPNFVFTNYTNLSSQEIEKLRKELRKSSSGYFVVKNAMAKRAFGDLKLKDLDQFLNGEVAIGLVGDVIQASKTFANFSKEHPALKINGAFIDGSVEAPDRIKHLAMLPPREVLIALVLNRMKGPITGFVGLLGGILRNFVYAINEIRKKREEGEKK